MINLEFDSMVFQEGNTYVAYSPKLDVSSCGDTVDEARNNLKTAVRLFLDDKGDATLYHDPAANKRVASPYSTRKGGAHAKGRYSRKR